MKRIAIILVAVAVIVLIALAYLFFGKNNRPAAIPSNVNSYSSNATGPVLAYSPNSSLPADIPQGDTFTLQGKSGAVVVKNIYKDAKGYWTAMDALVIDQNASYTILYYRLGGNFSIDLGAASTLGDQRAAEAELIAKLGVESPTFCDLPVLVTVSTDQSSPSDPGLYQQKQSIPLVTACPGGGFRSQ